MDTTDKSILTGAGSHFPRYVAVAFSSFLLDYAIFLLLVYSFGSHYLNAHIEARICSAIFNFLANKWLVFDSKQNPLPEIARYCVTVVFSLLMTALLLYLLVDFAGISKAIAKPSAEFTVFVLNFFILKRVVFQTKRTNGVTT